MFVKYSDFKYLGKTLDPSVGDRSPLKFYAQVTRTSGFPFFRKSESVIVFRSYCVPYWKELSTGKFTKGREVETLCEIFEAGEGKELSALPELYDPCAV